MARPRFATNNLPHISDLSNGTARRTLIMTLNNSFEGKAKKVGLADDILATEKEGIIQLALNAYAKAIKDEFTVRESSKLAAKQWLNDSNQVALFLQSEDCYS